MCPLKHEQARRETQQWLMRRLPTADSIVEIGRKVGHELRFSKHRRERFVMLGWSENIGRYKTPDTTVDIGPRK